MLRRRFSMVFVASVILQMTTLSSHGSAGLNDPEPAPTASVPSSPIRHMLTNSPDQSIIQYIKQQITQADASQSLSIDARFLTDKEVFTAIEKHLTKIKNSGTNHGKVSIVHDIRDKQALSALYKLKQQGAEVTEHSETHVKRVIIHDANGKGRLMIGSNNLSHQSQTNKECVLISKDDDDIFTHQTDHDLALLQRTPEKTKKKLTLPETPTKPTLLSSWEYDLSQSLAKRIRKPEAHQQTEIDMATMGFDQEDIHQALKDAAIGGAKVHLVVDKSAIVSQKGRNFLSDLDQYGVTISVYNSDGSIKGAEGTFPAIQHTKLLLRKVTNTQDHSTDHLTVISTGNTTNRSSTERNISHLLKETGNDAPLYTDAKNVFDEIVSSSTPFAKVDFPAIDQKKQATAQKRKLARLAEKENQPPAKKLAFQN